MGFGWIGYFDLEDRSYQLYYLEEVIPWSVRSIFADTKNVLAGLVCYSEYLYTSEGVIKFDFESQQVTTYPIAEPISHIYGCSGVYFLSSTDGFYILDSEQLFHATIDFDIDENYYIKGFQSVESR